MKKSTAIILLVILILYCSGCRTKEVTYRTPVEFHYCTKEIDYSANTSVIQSENRTVNFAPSDYKAIMQAYLNGPKSHDLYSPFPSDLAVVELSVEADTTYIIFNTSLSYLTGIDLTMACICIANTCLGLTHTQNIDISAEHALLDNAPSMLISNNTTLTTDIH